MKAVEFHGHFDDRGKLQATAFVAALNELRVRRVPVVLTVKEFKPKRSSQANRYYFGVVLPMICNGLEDLGWDPEDCEEGSVHEALKRKFLAKPRPITGDGEFLDISPSTAKLDKEDFGVYIEHCVRFAAEYLNVTIPPPNTQLQIRA